MSVPATDNFKFVFHTILIISEIARLGSIFVSCSCLSLNTSSEKSGVLSIIIHYRCCEKLSKFKRGVDFQRFYFAISKHLQEIIEMCRFQKWIFVLTPREELADLMVKLPPRCIGPTRQNDLTSPRQSNPKGFLKSGAAI